MGFIDALPNPDSLMNSWYPFIIAAVIGVLYGARQYFRGNSCTSSTKLDGKTAVITGGASGIGEATARDFATRGARVVIACRNLEDGDRVAKEIREVTGNINVIALKCDLASFQSVRDFVEQFKKKEDNLHILVNNAGVMMCQEDETGDEWDVHFQVNYLGHFLLTQLLLDMLKASAPSRIINLTAPAYHLGDINFEDINGRTEYNPGTQFAQSKLAIVFGTLELAKRLEGKNVTVNCVTPGVVRTRAHRSMAFHTNAFVRVCFSPFVWFLMKTPVDGAQTSIFCAVAESLEGVTGKFYGECEEKKLDAKALDETAQKELWKRTMEWLELKKKK